MPAAALPHTPWFSMGAVQSDFNNDGYIDFLLADMMPKTHYMQMASMASMLTQTCGLLCGTLRRGCAALPAGPIFVPIDEKGREFALARLSERFRILPVSLLTQ